MEITQEIVEGKTFGDNHFVVKHVQQQLLPLTVSLEKPELGMK